MEKQEEEERAEKLLTYFTPFGTLIVEPIIRERVTIFSMQEMNDTISYLEINGFATYRIDLSLHPYNTQGNTYVQLTEEGRYLKHLGSFKEYDKIQKEHLDKEAKRIALKDELLVAQVDINRSVISTNKTTRNLSWLTVVISLSSALISYVAYKTSADDNYLKSHLLQVESSKDSLENRLFQRMKDTIPVRILKDTSWVKILKK